MYSFIHATSVHSGYDAGPGPAFGILSVHTPAEPGEAGIVEGYLRIRKSNSTLQMAPIRFSTAGWSEERAVKHARDWMEHELANHLLRTPQDPLFGRWEPYTLHDVTENGRYDLRDFFGPDFFRFVADRTQSDELREALVAILRLPDLSS